MKVNVLIVDDSPILRKSIRKAVLMSGVDAEGISEAGNGAEALESIQHKEPDLVLLDINMPGMDGWETLRLIRADQALEAMPVVMFSIKGEMRDKIEGMQEGATDYITKPFEVDHLIERVGRVLEVPR